MALLAMSGCATLNSVNPFPRHIYSTPGSAQRQPQATAPRSAKTNPYTVMGRTYHPLKTAAGYAETGYASWYGEDFHGRKTANGEIYNMYALTAAHKTLPLGTRIRVTNLENGRNVILTVNDRGPFVSGRLLDLSYGAARQLGSVDRGVTKVRIEAIGTVPASRPVHASASTSYHVRVGAFANRDNAVNAHRTLIRAGYKGSRITTISRNGRTLHVVQAGSYSNRDRAERVRSALRPHFPSCYIVG